MEHYISLQILQLNMLYVNCVFILKACFKRIDDNLMILREFMIEDKSHTPRLIYYHQRNPLLLEELKVLRKEHLMISNTVQMLNKIFSLQLFATFTIAFIEITFEIYFNTVQWKNGLSINLTKQVHNSFIISYLTYHILKILLIIWSCEISQNQAIKISTTVHDVLNSTSDKNIKYELHLFSLQILHSNNTFSTKFFAVNATFLTTMVGTVTTYLLILIQFLVSSHSCDGKITKNN
ncbi:PREDICTED: putative gustatory receptor 28b [Atta colombica]|uniref:putative gustatory receptor 28b n=1 Tax=Atta colombica TaxID=520822 RepID=UPI00084C775A|nr:PREDICTED: putative gustatory receptor 28b [Atta colombica]